MKQITNQSEIIGKTIERTVSLKLDDEFWIFFTDNTFCIIDDCNEIQSSIEDLEVSFKTCNKLCELGIITDEERNKLWLKYTITNEEYKKQQELKILAELKLKYPNH